MHQWVNVNSVPFEVVGIYKFENEGEGGMMQRSPVFVPLSAAQRVFNAQREVDKIMFSFSDGSIVGSKMVQERAVHALARRHNFDPTDGRALQKSNNVENVATVSNIFGAITAFLWFVGIGSLIAGIVGIGNIMLIVVKDRTKETGIRKALGATPAKVVGQIMLEALFVTSIFGFIGLASAVGLLELLASVIPGTQFFRNPTIDLGVAVKALFALILSGALAGFFPARKAAAIRPIEALRYE